MCKLGTTQGDQAEIIQTSRLTNPRTRQETLKKVLVTRDSLSITDGERRTRCNGDYKLYTARLLFQLTNWHRYSVFLDGDILRSKPMYEFTRWVMYIKIGH